MTSDVITKINTVCICWAVRLLRLSDSLEAARWQSIWVRMYLTNVREKSGGTICNWVPFCIKNAIRVALTRVRIFLSRGIKNLDLKNATNFCLGVLSVKNDYIFHSNFLIPRNKKCLTLVRAT